MIRLIFDFMPLEDGSLLSYFAPNIFEESQMKKITGDDAITD